MIIIIIRLIVFVYKTVCTFNKLSYIYSANCINVIQFITSPSQYMRFLFFSELVSLNLRHRMLVGTRLFSAG